MPEDMANEVVVNKDSSNMTLPLRESNRSLIVAPGEGKLPNSLLREDDFDVKAFPKHHPNGQFGIHHVRQQKLTNQMYFNQRLLNQDERFSRDPCYLFTACYFIERQMIERQIDISGNDTFIIFAS